MRKNRVWAGRETCGDQKMAVQSMMTMRPDARGSVDAGVWHSSSGWLERLDQRHGRFLTVAIGVVLAVWIVYFAVSVHATVDPTYADSTADLLVAESASSGVSPYEDLHEISDVLGVPYATAIPATPGQTFVHPRTPAALLMLQPLTVADAEEALLAAHLLTLSTVLVVGLWLIPALTGIPLWQSMALAALLLFSGPVVRAFQFGSMSALVVLLVGGTWVLARRGDSWVAGVPLGVAIAIRLFPGLLLIPLLFYRKWKATAGALVSFVVLNAVGLLAFDLELPQVLEGFAATSDVWVDQSANGSAARLLPTAPFVSVVVVSLAVVVGVILIRRNGGSFIDAFALSAVGMLLASPLSWEHYDIMLVVVAFVVLVSDSAVGRWAGLAIVVLASAGYYLRQPFENAEVFSSGDFAMFMRLVLFAALLAAALKVRTPKLEAPA